jgi:hypothetical protein
LGRGPSSCLMHGGKSPFRRTSTKSRRPAYRYGFTAG